MPLSFEIDLKALLGALFFLALLFMAKRVMPPSPEPALLFSDTSLILSSKKSWKVKMANLPLYLFWSAFGLFLLAFMDPHFYTNKDTANSDNATEGIAIYLLVDRSGSMVSKVGGSGKSAGIEKLTLLKQITEQFINGSSSSGTELSGRQNDLIGLIAFARTAEVLSPLTLDHARIVEDLQKLAVVSNPREDGTAIGYALYKTVNIIAATRNFLGDLPKSDVPAYEIKSSIIILVTDGFDSPHLEDLDNPLRGMAPMQAALYAEENKVRVYIINIEPALSATKFAPQRHQMEDIAQKTGGKYYLMTDPAQLAKIYSDIDKLEKSVLIVPDDISKEMQPKKYQRISLYPYLIALGMFFLIVSVLLETFWLKRVP